MEEQHRDPSSSRYAFVEGLVREMNRGLFCYGGADKYIGVAYAPMPSADSR
jgi:predicted GH43/DUF377 family glycosyl hydrolase